MQKKLFWIVAILISFMIIFTGCPEEDKKPSKPAAECSCCKDGCDNIENCKCKCKDCECNAEKLPECDCCKSGNCTDENCECDCAGCECGKGEVTCDCCAGGECTDEDCDCDCAGCECGGMTCGCCGDGECNGNCDGECGPDCECDHEPCHCCGEDGNCNGLCGGHCGCEGCGCGAEAVVTSLTVTGDFKKVYYQYYDTEVNYNGLVVSAVYDNTDTIALPSTAFEISAFAAFNTAGKHNITVTYIPEPSITTTFEITVVALSGITLTPPSVVKYYQYHSMAVNFDDIVVTANYNAEFNHVIDSKHYSISQAVNFNVPNTYTVTVSYNADPQIKNTFTVEVIALTGLKIQSSHIVLNSAPSDAEIKKGVLDGEIELIAVYQDAQEHTVMDIEENDFTVNVQNNIPEPGKVTVSITWKEKTGSYQITISTSPILDRIEITANPVLGKFYQYITGIDKAGLAAAGLKVTAYYTLNGAASSNKELLLSEYEIEIGGENYFDKDKAGSQVIRITFSDINHVHVDLHVNTLPLEGLEITGIKTVYSSLPTAASVLGDIVTAFALYDDGECEYDIKSALTAASIAVNGTERTITVTWHETFVVNYTYSFSQGVIITFEEFTDITFENINIGHLSVFAPTVPVTITGNFTGIEWYLNGVHQSHYQYKETFEISAKDSHIGMNVLSVEAYSGGKLYRKNLIFTVGL